MKTEEEFYTINKYKRKENNYRRLTNNIYGMVYTLWDNCFFKGRRLYVEELIIYKEHCKVRKELKGKLSRFICPIYYMRGEV